MFQNGNIDVFHLPASPWPDITYSKNTISMMPLCCMAVSRIAVLSEAKESCNDLQVWCLHGFSVLACFLSAHLPLSAGRGQGCCLILLVLVWVQSCLGGVCVGGVLRAQMLSGCHPSIASNKKDSGCLHPSPCSGQETFASLSASASSVPSGPWRVDESYSETFISAPCFRRSLVLILALPRLP